MDLNCKPDDRFLVLRFATEVDSNHTLRARSAARYVARHVGHISHQPDPPLVIVTSHLADERLWAEALNLGAYDVLAKPFDAIEVGRILGLAWQHWQDRHELHGDRTKQRMATSGT